MKKDKPNSQEVDPNRVNRMLLRSPSYQQQQRAKRAVNISLFRQQVRRQQRDFRNQNHEYLKMCGMMVRSSQDKDKFNEIGKGSGNTKNYTKGTTMNIYQNKLQPIVQVPLDGQEFNCAVGEPKFPIKDIYTLLPFRKESVTFTSHYFLSSEFIFFLLQSHNANSQSLRYKLQNTVEQNLNNDFRSSINKMFKYVSFFDCLHYLNRPPPKNDYKYPQWLNKIAQGNANFLNKLDQQQKQMYNYNQIPVQKSKITQRLISCGENDLVDTGEILCFESMDDYSMYKAQRAIDFKFMKIMEKDAVINTNIRNIISTEKIYLVEIIQEVHSYIMLSRECQGTNIMGKVFEHLINKADEYLRLLCGYTQSKILTIYNIQNYQQKLYTFIEKSIRYKKQVRKIPASMLKQFPVLQIWYQLPQNLLGYSRQELHETFYQLMQAIIVFEGKMKDMDLYESLKKKRMGVKYVDERISQQTKRNGGKKMMKNR